MEFISFNQSEANAQRLTQPRRLLSDADLAEAIRRSKQDQGATEFELDEVLLDEVIRRSLELNEHTLARKQADFNKRILRVRSNWKELISKVDKQLGKGKAAAYLEDEKGIKTFKSDDFEVYNLTVQELTDRSSKIEEHVQRLEAADGKIQETIKAFDSVVYV